MPGFTSARVPGGVVASLLDHRLHAGKPPAPWQMDAEVTWDGATRPDAAVAHPLRWHVGTQPAAPRLLAGHELPYSLREDLGETACLNFLVRMKKGGRVFQPATSNPSPPATRRHAAYFTEPWQGRSRLPLSQPPPAACLGGKGSPGRCFLKPRCERGPGQYQARDERTTKDLRKQFVPARPIQPYRPRPGQRARPTVPTTPTSISPAG